MKFEINRMEMLMAAKNAARVAPNRSPVDVLNGILVEGNDDSGEVFLTATNYEVSIQQKVTASVGKSGAVLINPRLLVGMLSLLPGEFVTLSSAKPEVITVTGGNSVYEINCLPAKHYPKPVMPFPEETAKLTGICSLAKRTVFAVSNDEHKPALQCVSVKLRNNAVHAAACDGVRMMLIKDIASSPDECEFLLPGRSLLTLASISTDKDAFEVGDIGNEIVFTRENMMFTMRKMPGDYMDVNTVIKSIVPVYSAVTSAGEMLKCLELIQIGAGSQPVNLVLTKDAVKLNCDGENAAVQAAATAVVSKNTPSAGFYYNTDKLCKLFQVVTGRVKIELDAKGMMLIKSRSEVYFQVPQRPVAKKKPAHIPKAA